ncbi:putative sporulation protein YtaF [Paenibacillus allorhizoplanae]|jgi:putative Mn2+ efflux pump MntP|uniref:Sporulation protein YtaF n=1 Tax=Paenibacillus allorhizoplanae TaxID=2905648 RepID=A0ABM9C1Z5_9BACL|nr:MntP/YtaF family protein [Paenibacillus allorhizoplanae]CAH1200013.1 putative sporulation protein YtaF [Paenibacillus allorhizoplanae]
MLPVISLLILAFAVSLDGFGVGVMYGLRKIRIPLISIGIISLWSGIIIFTSMQIGVLMSSFMSPGFAKRIGALILIGIGVWALVQMRQGQKNQTQQEQTAATADQAMVSSMPYGEIRNSGYVEPVTFDTLQRTKEILSIELKRFGLVIQILRTPSIADVDKSGNISASEATLLGLALSLDAFGAGIGAALIGFVPLLTASVISISSGSLLAVGLRIGFRYAEMNWMKKLSILPGCVLIVMGLLKML